MKATGFPLAYVCVGPMPNQKWDDATVASVLVRLVRFMGMPSIPWEDFGDQVDIPGYKLKCA